MYMAAGHEHDALLLDGVLERVLIHVTQSDRLGLAALVCKRWHAAAVAATAETGLEINKCTAAAEAWLLRYGAKLKLLWVKRGKFCPVGQGFFLAGLPQLACLVVEETVSAPSMLRAIGHHLKNLVQLELHNIEWGMLIGTEKRADFADATRHMCSSLTGLTTLVMCGCDLHDACTQQLSTSLKNLKALDLSVNGLAQAQQLAPLPPGLTRLEVGHNSEDFDLARLLSAAGSANRSGIASQWVSTLISSNIGASSGSVVLPQLLHLDISGLWLQHPACLSGLTSLTWLSAAEVTAPEELLSAVASLRQLQHLQLSNISPPSMHVTMLQAALQPLLQLTFLDMSYNKLFSDATLARRNQQQQQPQPQHLFAGLQLPQLRHLVANELEECAPSRRHIGRIQAPGTPAPFLKPADLQHLVSSCPQLQHLSLLKSFVHGFCSSQELEPLLQLQPMLTALALGSGAWSLDDDGLRVLAQLTGLQSLDLIHVGPEVTDAGLCALTQLTQLSQLTVDGLDADTVSNVVVPRLGQDTKYHKKLHLSSKSRLKAKGRAGASVSQQLKARCDRSPFLWEDRQKELQQQLKEAQKQVKEAKKEATRERNKAAAAERQAQAAQQQAEAAFEEVSALRQQLAALQAGAAQQQEGQQDVGPHAAQHGIVE